MNETLEIEKEKVCDGDAFVIRDLLVEAGFRFGQHFVIRKVQCED